MAPNITVDMGTYVVAHNPTTLMCMALGSCVGVAIYDPKKKIGGLAHVMLPNSKEKIREDENKFKYADISIPSMIEEMKKKGGVIRRMTAKIAGGAHMFATLNATGLTQIGKRNEVSVREQLEKLGIPVVAHQTGGAVGRTIRFDTVSGKVEVKMVDRTMRM